MSIVWPETEKLEHVNLKDIMYEEISKRNQTRRGNFCGNIISKSITTPVGTAADENFEVVPNEKFEDNESDELMTKILHMGFKEQHIEKINSTKLMTESSKLLHENYRTNDLVQDTEEELLASIQETKTFDDELQEHVIALPYGGYKKPNRGLVSALYDVIVSKKSEKKKSKQRSNHPDFLIVKTPTKRKCYKFSNSVNSNIIIEKKPGRYNVVNKKRQTIAILEENSYYIHALLSKMIKDGLFKKIIYILNISKEAIIFYANRNIPLPNDTIERGDCIIKMYSPTLSYMQTINEKIELNHTNIEENRKKYLQRLAEKEMVNLIRLRNAGVPCPQIFGIRQNVVVMSSIGTVFRQAPMLRDVIAGLDELYDIYRQVTEGMKMMYEKANLIHGNLSEDNILYYDKRCYFISLSHAIEPIRTSSFKFLYKDCQRINKFFHTKYCRYIFTAKELFSYVTGYDFGNKDSLRATAESLRNRLYPMKEGKMELVAHLANLEKDTSPEIPQINKATDINNHDLMPSACKELEKLEPVSLKDVICKEINRNQSMESNQSPDEKCYRHTISETEKTITVDGSDEEFEFVYKEDLENNEPTKETFQI